ncbi:MAG TPA: hypothetical protein VG269_16295 [Tepidisphaeraceae bacterium]|jgi:hypothetical protein|nr:hypothetical protein [Tepidisphaeraceae bacterium]
MKVVLILACFAVVVRSGPLPASLWDEVIEGWCSAFEGSESAGQAEFAAAGRPELATPADDDTPEDLAFDQLIQQSTGDLRETTPSLRDDLSAAAACTPCVDFSGNIVASPPIVSPPRAFSPPLPAIRYSPLLI